MPAGRKRKPALFDAAYSRDGDAAIHDDGLTRDVAGGIGGQPHRGGGELLWVAQALQQDARSKAVKVAGLILVGHLRFEEPWCDRVDSNSLSRSPRLGQIKRQAHDRSFAGAAAGEYARAGAHRRASTSWSMLRGRSATYRKTGKAWGVGDRVMRAVG